MKTEDVLILAAIVGGGVYLYSRNNKTAGATADNGFRLPTFPNQFNPIPSQNGSSQPDGYQTGAAFAGMALSAATGIPGFDKVGAKIASLFGQGRKQADDLVQHYQNPILQDHAGAIINAWHEALATGKATSQVKEMVKQQLVSMVQGFIQIASEPQFSKAGPGGIATANHVLNDIWLPNIELEWQQQGVA